MMQRSECFSLAGLRTACDAAFNSSGFAERRDHDRKRLSETAFDSGSRQHPAAVAGRMAQRRIDEEEEADDWHCRSVATGEHHATPPLEGFVECNSR